MLFLTLIPLSVNAATSGTYGSNITWTLDDNGLLTISGNGVMEELDSLYKIPWYQQANSIKSIKINKGITTIAGRAFWGCKKATSIIIPDGVTTIGVSAFRQCTSLTDIELPDSISLIGNYAFDECTSLESIDIPYGVTLIAGPTFNNCINLTNVTIPESVEIIYGSAFYGCKNLKSITIPANVTEIGSYAFYGTGLTNVYYNSYKKDWNNIKIDVGNETLTTATLHYLIPTSGICGDNLTWILNGDGKLTISGTGEMYSFEDEEPEWYESKSNIKEVIFNDGVTSVGDYAFSNCTSLTSVSMPNGLKKIGIAAFMNCNNIKILNIPNTVTTISKSAFSNCYYITKVSMPNVTSIGSEAFKGCISLNEISIPDGASIGTWAFGNCSTLEKVTIGNIGTIKDYAFYQCYDISDLSIAEGVHTIGNYAFYYCNSLTNVTLPESVKYIYPYAFRSCTKLKTINLPTNLISVGNSAFEYCDSLTDVYCNVRNATWEDIRKKVSISSYNNALTNTMLHGLNININVTKTNNIFTVSPLNVYNNEYIIFACYNGNRMVYVNPYVYSGEITIPFTTTETYDKVKVMVWENLETCVPLCEAKEVPLN